MRRAICQHPAFARTLTQAWEKNGKNEKTLDGSEQSGSSPNTAKSVWFFASRIALIYEIST